MTHPAQTAATPEPTAEDRDLARRLVKSLLMRSHEECSKYHEVVAKLIRTHVAAEVAKATKELREVLEEVHARSSAVLNNGHPDEAPEALAGICKLVALAARAPRDGGAVAPPALTPPNSPA